MKFSQYIDSGLSFHSPIAQEEWDRITDVELERTDEITFQTPSGNEVPFRKVKHGHWELDGTCSFCKKHTLQSYGNFCCYCGADMREMKETMVFCEKCRKLVNYNVNEKETTRELKDTNVKFVEKIARCSECGCEVYVDEINDMNLDELYNQYIICKEKQNDK